MRSGTLRNRVEIQAATTVRQASGQAKKSWSTVATVWGELRTVTGREYVVADQARAQLTHAIRLRFVSGLLPTHRLRLGSRVFEIVSVDNTSNRDREVVAVVKEQVQPTP